MSEEKEIVEEEKSEVVERENESLNQTDDSISESNTGDDDREQLIKDLEEENSELKTQYLRKQADFENYRKRMTREKQEAIKFANTNLLTDIIDVIDNFERAIKSSEDSKDFNSFHEGIVMIEKQFVSMLEQKYGLKRLESIGKVFDPSCHEAIAMEESEEHEDSVVLEDFQKGYTLNDRVIRTAKVKVTKPVAKASEEAE